MTEPAAPTPHIIRLRGPWKYEPLARYLRTEDGRLEQSRDKLPSAGTINFPADWESLFAGRFHGTVPTCQVYGIGTADRQRRRLRGFSDKTPHQHG